jgi:tetratricopeptide (TPR) repeat protein
MVESPHHRGAAMRPPLVSAMRLFLLVAYLTLTSTPLAAQATDHIARGDEAYTALRPLDAVTHYEAAVAEDSAGYEALWKASRSLADLAEYEGDKTKRTDMYRRAEQLAQRAVAVNPGDAEAHFHLARALGRVALSLGPKDRVKYGKAVREHALEALRLDPDHPGALHVMGMWNAEVRRLPGIARFFAKSFLGGGIFGSANWGEAVRLLSRAVEVDPQRIAHHLDLARIYRDTDDFAQARLHYQHVIEGAATDYNDAHYKREAAAELERLKDRD